MFTFSTFIHAMNLALLPKVGRGMENKYFFAQNVSERKLCVVNKAHFAPKKKVARLDSTLLRILCCFLDRKKSNNAHFCKSKRSLLQSRV